MIEQRSQRPFKKFNFPPQPTPFIGRTTELAEIMNILSDPTCRLLTLIGPGGIGKTRLAIQVASEMQDRFSHGLYFVALQPVRSADLLVSAVATAVNLSLAGQDDPAVQLLDYLRDKEMLLVLDSFEQWLEGGVGLLIDLLWAAPGIKLLVTSREVLNMQEEWLYPVQGLDFPMSCQELSGSGAAQAKEAELYSAVQLFVERARRVRPDFSLAEELVEVVRICQLVGGIPLAIELAAAWSKTLRCAVIAAEIQRNLDFLSTGLRNAPERQRSMRAVFDQSWKLLSEQEQNVFKRLAVFRDGFRREAAERVAQASLASLSALVDKSLLRLEHDGRYQIHELLRQYAAEYLVQSAEDVARVYDLHCAYYADFLNKRRADVLGGRQKEVKADIEADLENIRLAWQWAIELVKVEEIQKSALSLVLFYQVTSRYSEGVTTYEKAAANLDMAKPAGQQGPTLAEILVELGWMYIRVGQLEKARLAIERSHRIFSELDMAPPPGMGTDPLIPLAVLAIIGGDYTAAAELGQRSRQAAETRLDQHNLSFAYYVLTGAALAEGGYELAYQHAQQAYTLAKASGNTWFMAYCLNELGNVATAMAEYAAAKGYYEASYAIRKGFNDPEGMAVALNYLGKIALLQANYVEARRLYQQSLAIYREINDKGGLARSLNGLGAIAAASAANDMARQYFQEALQIATDIQFMPLTLAIINGLGEMFWRAGQPERGLELMALVRHHPASDRETRDRAEQCLSDYQGDLTPDSFAAVVERGQNHNLEAIVPMLQAELAAQVGYDRVEEDTFFSLNELEPAREQPLIEPLTSRELEVLHLIAQGKTNQQMAEELIISVGTAKWYTSQIYGKLNVNNRTQAVARARDLALLV
jgi:predicted ATPase/DNA-binding CsgD family transcriptional regulator